MTVLSTLLYLKYMSKSSQVVYLVIKMRLYKTDEFHQLFKSSVNEQVIYLEVVDGDRFKMFQGTVLTMSEMEESNWFPIDSSSYIGPA